MDEEKNKDVVEGALEINLKAGGKCSVCTCGASKHLPYCDNSHRNLNEKEGTNYKSLKIVSSEETKLYVSSSAWDEQS